MAKRVIEPAEEVPPPTVPMDYSWARVSCAGLAAFGFFGTARALAVILDAMLGLYLVLCSVTYELC